jgi:AAA domain-containing protein
MRLKRRTNGKNKEKESNDLGIKPVSLLGRPLSWAIYGKSGTGKTTFSSTCLKPILILDVRDQGTDSIADHEDIDMKEIETWDDFEEIYYFLKENPKRYKTVVIDTITQLQQMCLEHVMKDKKKDSARLGDWGTLTKRDWGEASGMMKDWIVNYRNLPLEVVFLAQERVTTVDEDEAAENPDNMITPEVGPHVMASVKVALNAAVSIVANTFVGIRRYKKEINGKKISKEETRYGLRLGANPIYDTKIRKPKSVEVPSVIWNPTRKDVIDIIKGE